MAKRRRETDKQNDTKRFELTDWILMGYGTYVIRINYEITLMGWDGQLHNTIGANAKWRSVCRGQIVVEDKLSSSILRALFKA